MADDGFVDAAPADYLEPGETATVDVDGTPVTLANADGTWCAYQHMCPHQATSLVAQGTGQAVDFRLGRENHLLLYRQPQEPAHPFDELDHLIIGKGIAERKHRHRMPHLGKFLRRLCADATRGRVGPHQLREQRLDLLVAPAQCVIVRV